MKLYKTLIIALLLVAVTPLSAQTADEIIANYFENTGGAENWEKLQGQKFIGVIKMQGMELPMTKIDLANGKTLSSGDFQGMTFYQEVFDGENLWGTNQMTMEAEKSDSEATENFKKNINDFPNPFLNYKDKGYTVELIGTEVVEGVETFKLKLVKEPIMADGKQIDDVSYYYFEKENFVPIVMEQEMNSGQMKGMNIVVKMSDYQEVDGLFFPFSMTQGVEGLGESEIVVKEIILNPEVDEAMFAFPK